jgi:RsiW-degrading membrane proteinase PrsW (M82 family)
MYPAPMLALAVLLALLVPALAYASLIYLLDLHEREPPWALGLAFVLGSLAAPLALSAERALLSQLPSISPGFASNLQLSCFTVIGPVEELAKLAVTLLFARRALMNEPVDGVVYAGFVALGFAAGEGVLGAKGLSAWALLLRALLPLPAHVFFSSLWGASLGALRHWGRGFAPLLVVAFLAAALLHGGYDYLLFVDGGRQRGSVVALIAAAGVLCALLFRALLSASPFRDVTSRRGRCTHCEQPFDVRARFCAGCGDLLVTPSRGLPLDFTAVLSAFLGQGGLLLASVWSLARVRGLAPAALWAEGLAGPSQACAWLVCCAALGALFASLASVRLARGGALELLLGCALAWCCTLLYLTLTVPELMPRALALWGLTLGLASALRSLLPSAQLRERR